MLLYELSENKEQPRNFYSVLSEMSYEDLRFSEDNLTYNMLLR